MSDEVVIDDPVVQPETKEELSPLAEITTPSQDSQVEEVIEPKEEGPKTIPKDRFDQVYARAKKAEEKAAALEAERQKEREDRIRLEERLKAQETKTKAEPEYTWDQLENFIAEGKVTRGQAQEYKDEMTRKKLKQEFEQKQVVESKNARILGEIEQYKQLVPDIMTYGSETRRKYESVYSRYVQELGMPDNYATQLAATQAAFGDIDTVKSRSTTRQTITPKESFMETHTPSPSKTKETKSFKDTLSKVKYDHYERMIKHGIHKDWKEVEALEKA